MCSRRRDSCDVIMYGLQARLLWVMKAKRPKPGDPAYRHPYTDYEADPLWPLIEKGIGDLVENKDLVEKEDRNYIVGYLCKVILKGRKRAELKKL